MVIKETIDPINKGYIPNEVLIKEVAKEAEKRAEGIMVTEKEFRVRDKVEIH
jgi:hypothetical protein